MAAHTKPLALCRALDSLVWKGDGGVADKWEHWIGGVQACYETVAVTADGEILPLPTRSTADSRRLLPEQNKSTKICYTVISAINYLKGTSWKVHF